MEFRRTPFTNPWSLFGRRADRTALTDSLTAADSGIRSRKKIWKSPTRRAWRTNGLNFLSGCLQRCCSMISSDSRLRSRPKIIVVASCRSLLSSGNWVRALLKRALTGLRLFSNSHRVVMTTKRADFFGEGGNGKFKNQGAVRLSMAPISSSIGEPLDIRDGVFSPLAMFSASSGVTIPER